MENLLEKVKVQVDRNTVNLPEDRKTLQEFGKIWKKVYETLKTSPEQIPKYKNIIKKIANSATTGMIDKLAGRFSFMGKTFDVEVDKSKWSEFAPTPWKIGFVGNLGENIVNEAKKFKKGDKIGTRITHDLKADKLAGKSGKIIKYAGKEGNEDVWLVDFGGGRKVQVGDTDMELNESLICELPHGDYAEKGIDAIDFAIEKLPISPKQKEKLVKNFRSGKGIIGRLPKSNKLMLFTPKGMKVIKQEPKDKSMILPPGWSKYATILKDHIGEIAMKKNELKEMIRSLVREILNEKWKDGVEIKSTGEHAGKTIAQLKKEIEALRGKPGNKEKMGELVFALRAKQGWKKGKGAAGLSKEKE
jgi:hypothetical protein